MVFSSATCRFPLPLYPVWAMPMEPNMLVVHALVSRAYLMIDEDNPCGYALEYLGAGACL